MRSCQYKMAGTNKTKEPAELAWSLRKGGQRLKPQSGGEGRGRRLSQRTEAGAQGVETGLGLVEAELFQTVSTTGL